MKVLRPQLNNRSIPPGESTGKQKNFGEGVPGYTGPADGLSHPRFTGAIKTLNRWMIAGAYRLEVEGGENFPHQGASGLCSHPSQHVRPTPDRLFERPGYEISGQHLRV